MLPPNLYLRVREKEGRLYRDDVVAHLPEVPSGHPLRSEWQARGRSLQRLQAYLRDFAVARPARLMELGCGNGWLSRRLADIPGWQVFGLDQLGPELAQAQRLVGSRALAFLSADIFAPSFACTTFDIIVVASAIQYFPDLPGLVRTLCSLLKPRGELHILDSPFYDERTLSEARHRTELYYAGLGFPEMAHHYFHHTFSELSGFAPRWLYQPQGVSTRLLGALGRLDSPFPWLAIRKTELGES